MLVREKILSYLFENLVFEKFDGIEGLDFWKCYMESNENALVFDM